LAVDTISIVLVIFRVLVTDFIRFFISL
jgi:hypothetical protein